MSDAPPIPPRARLLRIVESLARHLPTQFESLLGAPRFASDAEALVRLGVALHAGAAVADMPEAEAAWLADRLLERWARIAEPKLEPAATVIGPNEIWIGARPSRVSVHVAVDGLDPGWRAAWTGDVIRGPDDGAIVVAQPPSDDAPAWAIAEVRVEGRAGETRAVLRARRRFAIRRPVAIVADARTRIRITDHTGRIAAGVEVALASQTYVTGDDGGIELDAPVAAGLRITVEQIDAGRA